MVGPALRASAVGEIPAAAALHAEEAALLALGASPGRPAGACSNVGAAEDVQRIRRGAVVADLQRGEHGVAGVDAGGVREAGEVGAERAIHAIRARLARLGRRTAEGALLAPALFGSDGAEASGRAVSRAQLARRGAPLALVAAHAATVALVHPGLGRIRARLAQKRCRGAEGAPLARRASLARRRAFGGAEGALVAGPATVDALRRKGPDLAGLAVEA
mmetsp:Transcript_11816/g.33688  ORF Transcript_11816/g.33688 Transcript_11816/m.33688 type:complete len:219 (+) Transcript_11816:325-981(+)